MTVRRLVLLRHAKSDRPEGTPDHERPLAKRGRRDADAAGRWLAEHDLRPDLTVLSDAVRARETGEQVVSALGPAPAEAPVRHEPRAYDADPDELLEVVRETPDEIETLLLVGHNPGVEDLAKLLDDGAAGDLRAVLDQGLKTSGIVVLELDCAWADLAYRSARLRQVEAPRGS